MLFYGCETWCLTLREEHRLRAYDKRVLRRIFGHKKEEVAGSWKKQYNEEFRNLNTSPNIIRGIKTMRMRRQEMQHAR
jgi:hypothetical protein